MKNNIRYGLLCMLPFLIGGNLQATLLAYEGFDSSVYDTGASDTGADYATDSLSGQGTGSGSGFSSNWGAATTDGLALGDYWLNSDDSVSAAYYRASTGQTSYTDGASASLETTSGQATFTGDGTRVSLQRFATTGLSASSSLYFSALVTLDASSSGILFGAASVPNSGNDRPFQFGFNSSGNLTAVGWSSNSEPGSEITSATSYGAGTYLLVAKLINSGDDLELWVNPLLGNEAGSGAADLTIAGGGFFVPNNSSFSIDGITIDATGPGSVSLDEIRMGTTWDDVTPSAIPEASTLMLSVLAAASVFLGIRRRR